MSLLPTSYPLTIAKDGLPALLLRLILFHQGAHAQVLPHSDLDLALVRLGVMADVADGFALVHGFGLGLESCIDLGADAVEVEAHGKGVFSVGVVLGFSLFVLEAESVLVQMAGGGIGDTDVEGDVFGLEGLDHGKFYK